MQHWNAKMRDIMKFYFVWLKNKLQITQIPLPSNWIAVFFLTEPIFAHGNSTQQSTSVADWFDWYHSNLLEVQHVENEQVLPILNLWSTI